MDNISMRYRLDSIMKDNMSSDQTIPVYWLSMDKFWLFGF